MALRKGNVDKTAEDDAPVWEEETEAVEVPEETQAAAAEYAETEREPVATQPAQSQAIAPQTQSKAVAAPSGGRTVAALAEQGFGGLSLGFGSLPQIVLKDGQFGNDDMELGEEFEAVLMNSQEKFVYKNDAGDRSPDNELVFSYDNQTTTSGEPLDDVIKQWKAKGLGHTVKKYLDVTLQIVGGEYDGTLAIASVPPTSVNRFSGYLVTVQMQQRKLPNQVVTKVYRGAKVTKVQFPFYPWAFKYVRDYE